MTTGSSGGSNAAVHEVSQVPCLLARSLQPKPAPAQRPQHPSPHSIQGVQLSGSPSSPSQKQPRFLSPLPPHIKTYNALRVPHSH
jgi:hypothetical protein